MIKELVKAVPRSLKRLNVTPTSDFHSDAYLRIDHRRLEHLASLRLDLSGKTVLEVGAGIGDLTSFFVDRGCQVVSTDGRQKNLKILRSRFPAVDCRMLDLNAPDPSFDGEFDIVFAYGILYHLSDPVKAIEFMAKRCSGKLLLSTCVSVGRDASMNPVKEPTSVPSQSVSGVGCRPTRPWVVDQLRSHFPHVYLPTTQPNHEQFPIDWDNKPTGDQLTRAVFIGSRQPLDHELLVDDIPMKQTRH